ncbi:uncharacterized protein [Lepeophtheirus salmonis]|uniref:Uncharacterized protein n=1 Tax=Lepeophtheirus salmonis TaxID=72036 RepID=A0A0K2TDU1_LEPSM|nr:uncharacterized protein LOC121129192 isoform X1 [Lepeophtheirus salmonis]
MKQFISIAASLLLAVAMVSAEEFDSELTEMEADPRLFFVNFTSSLIQVNSTLLAYGLLFLAVLGAGAVALYYLYLESQNGSSYDAYGSSNSNYNYNYARSSNDAFEFNHLNILQWISLLQEVYEKFDYNDLECQKRLICEVMKEPTYYGTAAQKFKNGFQYAKYLEVLSLPDDMRELLDEYMDANNRADQSKECSEFFDCPYSIKDSVKRNLSGNDL